jgi:hypothetical protein
MISKIYESPYKLKQMGRKKGTKFKERADAYRDAARMSRIRPRIARIVNYKKTDEQ